MSSYTFPVKCIMLQSNTHSVCVFSCVSFPSFDIDREQLELDAASKTTPEVLEVMDTSSESKQQSIAQLVYSDNRVSIRHSC